MISLLQKALDELLEFCDGSEAIDALKKAIDKGEPAAEWLDISTAPMDGSSVIAMYMHNYTPIVHNVFWLDDGDDGAGWWTYAHSELSRELLDGWKTPTGWMPLPEGDAK